MSVWASPIYCFVVTERLFSAGSAGRGEPRPYEEILDLLPIWKSAGRDRNRETYAENVHDDGNERAAQSKVPLRECRQGNHDQIHEKEHKHAVKCARQQIVFGQRWQVADGKIEDQRRDHRDQDVTKQPERR